MTAVDLRRARRLVELVHDLPAEQRRAVLARECGTDGRLLAEVEELLAAAAAAPDLLLRAERLPAAAELAREGAPDPPSGSRIGGFRLLGRIGAGGMGTVWEAEQDSPRRRVALKTLRLSDPSPEAARRFRHESEILARLRHPAIAQVFASGVHVLPGGERLPWYALEHVEDARSITEHARERGLGTRGRLELVARLADAVQHAHERGVVHRDLKPSNVLVDGAGELKVIDFGVARVRDAGGAPASLQTENGRVLGTLQYMAPEQVAGATEAVDARSDVYALGVVLYELVTGELPHDLTRATLAEAARRVAEEAPRRPRALVPTLPADLDAIALKALAKEPERRYASAGDLAADLRRHLRAEPVLARPPSASYRARVFARRHRVVVGSALAAVLTLAGAAPLGLWLAWRAHRAEAEAVVQRDEARFRAYAAEIAAAYAALRGLDAVSARQHLERCDETLRGFEWWLLWRRLDRSLWTRTIDSSGAADVAWHPDGSRIFVATAHGAVESRDARTGRLIERVEPATEALVRIELDPAGRRAAVTARSGWTRLLSLEPLGQVAAWRPHEPFAPHAVFDPSGDVLYTCGWAGDVAAWDARRATRLRDLEPAGNALLALAVSPDGRWLAGGSTSSGEVLLWELGTGKLSWRRTGHEGYVSALAFDPGGRLLVSASHDHTLRAWEIPEGTPRGVLRGHGDLVQCVAFDPSGSRLASGGWDRTVRLWDVEQGRELGALLGSEHNVDGLAFSPDGSHLAVVDVAPHLKLWSVDALRPDVVEVRGKWLWTLRAWPDGRSVLAVHGGFAERFEARSARVLARYPYRDTEWRSGDVSPDGERVALGSASGDLELWPADGGAPLVSRRAGTSALGALAWSDDGQRIAAGFASGALHVLDGGGNELRALPPAAAPVQALSFAPGGRALASVGPRGELRVQDADAGTLLVESAPTFAEALDLAWSPDGGRVALALEDGRIALLDARTGAEVRTLLGHVAGVTGVAFAPDSSRLLSGSLDRSVRLWDPATGREVAAFTDHGYAVDAVAFCDDSTAVSGSPDSTLRWWDAGSRAEREAVRAPGSGRVADDDPAELAHEAWRLGRAPASEPGLLARALQLAGEALRRAPREVAAHRALAAARLRSGDPSGALAAVDSARSVLGVDATCEVLRVLALTRLGRTDEARAALDELAPLLTPGPVPHQVGLRELAVEARAGLGR